MPILSIFLWSKNGPQIFGPFKLKDFKLLFSRTGTTRAITTTLGHDLIYSAKT